MIRPRLFVPLVLVLFLLAAGCSDRSSRSEPSPSPSATATTPATASRTPATATPTATASPTTPPPSDTPTPVPPTATPTTPSQPATGQVIMHGDRSSAQIALTFDMGGRVDPALDIMNWLISNDIHATIFMTGAMAANQNTEAGRDVLRLLDAHTSQFALGNHSYSHPDFRELSGDAMRDELARTDAAMAPYTSVDARPLFRPPFGGQDETVVAEVAVAGYTRVIMWDIDTIDWRPESEGGPTADDIVQKVLANAQGGSIVLMHLGGFNTFDALPAMVDGLRARGFEFVTVREMLGLD
ncbi:MAG: polysaccharide deacetylase family protein [Hyphomicrobiales bacterium]